MERGMVIIT